MPTPPQPPALTDPYDQALLYLDALTAGHEHRTLLTLGGGRVDPATGKRRFWNQGFDPGTPVEDVARMALDDDRHGHDVYLALGRFGDGRTPRGMAARRADNCLGSACLYVDLDVKDGAYPDLRAATGALGAALKALRVPSPTVWVRSGNGLHVYWTLPAVLEPSVWTPLARRLADGLVGAGLVFDALCTVDICRVLRVPGTRNWKDRDAPKPVRLLRALPRLSGGDLAVLADRLPAASLASYRSVPAALPLAIQGSAPAAALAQAASGASGPAAIGDELTGGVEGRPVDLSLTVVECPMFAEALATGGEGHQQPLWRSFVQVCTYAADEAEARDMAHRLSRGHAGYQAAQTDALFDQIMTARATSPFGPHSCEHMGRMYEATLGTIPPCATCPQRRAGIKGPGYPRRIASAAPDFVPPPSVPAGTVTDSFAGYWPDTGKRGGMWFTQPPRGGKGEPIPVQACPYHVLEPTRVEDDQGRVYLRAEWRLGSTVKRAYLGVEEMNDAQRFRGFLGRHGMTIGDIQQATTRAMSTSFTTQLMRMGQPSTFMPRTLGWHEIKGPGKGGGTGFALGGTFHRPRAMGDIEAMDCAPEHRSLSYAYEPRGDAGRWLAAANTILTDDDRPASHLIVAASFGSPLLGLARVLGAVLSIVSPAERGKSTLMRLAQSVWANPEGGMGAVDDTEAFILTRAGYLNCLPLLWDEVRDAKGVLGFFRLTQGQTKGRLNSNARANGIETFHCQPVLASNQSIADLMDRSGAAGTARVLELDLPPHPAAMLPHKDACDAADGVVKRHHGVFGPLYIRSLLSNLPQVEAHFTALHRTVNTAPSLAGIDRRFKSNTAAACLLGAVMANRLGLTALSPTLVKKGLIDAIRQAAPPAAGAVGHHPVEVRALLDFLHDNRWGQLVLQGVIPVGQAPREAVCVVIEQAAGSIAIRGRSLDDWLIKAQHPIRPTIQRLMSVHGLVIEHRPLAKGVAGHAFPKEKVYVIRKPADPFDSLVG